MSRLHQGCPDIAISRLMASVQSLPCAFFLPWTDSRPRAEVLSIWKPRQIGSHFGHQHIDHLSTDPGNLLTALDLLFKRGQSLLDLLLHMLDRQTLGIDETEQFP